MKVLHVFPLSPHKSMTVFGSVNANFVLRQNERMGNENQFLFCCSHEHDLRAELETKLETKSSPSIDYAYGNVEVLKYIRNSDADKIFLHQLPPYRVQASLFLTNFLRRKLRLSWFVWGGDLYNLHYRTLKGEKISFPKRLETWIKYVITSMFITKVDTIFAMPDDQEVVKQVYPKYPGKLSYFRYPFQSLSEFNESRKSKTVGKKIFISHSATRENNHKEVLDQLSFLSKDDVEIYSVLSYGADDAYVQSICEYGTRLFGDKFKPVLEFMTPEDYKLFIAEMDIAIFVAERQTGISALLAMMSSGAKIYYKSDVSPFEWFKLLKLKVHDTHTVREETKAEFLALDFNELKNNAENIQIEYQDARTLEVYQDAIRES